MSFSSSRCSMEPGLGDRSRRQERLQDLGEAGLLDRLRTFCPPGVVGDDAALLPWLSPKLGELPPDLVVTTDVLVEGIHFSPQTTPPHSVGWRAAAANLSDLAAMGAAPIGLTVGLSLPGSTPWVWVEDLYRGLTECAAPWAAPIVGGDVTRSPLAVLSITALGRVEASQAIRRSQAQPGDAILVTGVHGAARAGLELLLKHPPGRRPKRLTEDEAAELICAHQYPRPRLDAIAKRPPVGRVAGMDSSDGLADAIVQLCQASQVSARLDRAALNLPPGLEAWVGPELALDWALYGGEDFELVLCLPRPAAEAWRDRLGSQAAILGEILPGVQPNGAVIEVLLVDSTGKNPPEALTRDRGFQHFEAT